MASRARTEQSYLGARYLLMVVDLVTFWIELVTKPLPEAYNSHFHLSQLYSHHVTKHVMYLVTSYSTSTYTCHTKGQNAGLWETYQ